MYRRKIFQLLAALLLFNSLVYSYLEIMVPIWGYLGYDEAFSLERYILSTIIVSMMSFITPSRICGFHSFIQVIFQSITIIPSAVLYSTRGFDFLYFLSILIFYIIIKTVPDYLKVKIPHRKSSRYLVNGISILVILIFVSAVIFKGGLNVINFDVAKIYDLRDSAREQFLNFPFNYISAWSANVFVPFVLSIGIMYRKPSLIIFSITSAILFFGTLAQKTPIAMLVFCLFALWAISKKIYTGLFQIYLTGLVAIAATLHLWFKLSFFASLLIMRVFFGPANNNILYYEFFSTNPKTYFSNSFLSGLVDYPYSTHVFDIISTVRIGSPGINPNTGVLGTGFMHFGYFGMFFYSLVVSLLVIIILALSRGFPAWLSTAVCGPAMFIMLTSTDASVALVTNGLLISILLLFLLPKSELATSLMETRFEK